MFITARERERERERERREKKRVWFERWEAPGRMKVKNPDMLNLATFFFFGLCFLVS